MQQRCFSPAVRWPDDVHAYLEASFGQQRLARISRALCLPPTKLALRVNTLQTSTPESVAARLKAELSLDRAPSAPYSGLPYLLILQGQGPNAIPYDELCGDREVVVNRAAGEAILKGADLFVPGVLATSAGLAAGQLCAVSCALELPGRSWSGFNRGTVLPPSSNSNSSSDESFDNLNSASSSSSESSNGKAQKKRSRQSGAAAPGARSHLYLGAGRLQLGRKELFRAEQGVALTMELRVYDMPACNGVLRGEVMLQALPSVVAAAVLDPQPGMRVLDMCAAPGGKTTLIAQLMGGEGKVVAFDRTFPKVDRIRSLAADQGLSGCVEALRMDATTAAGVYSIEGERWGDNDSNSESSNKESSSTAPAESFDAVMLDPPCTALGIRPRLLHSWGLQQMLSLGRYQRHLMATAVRLLKPGGTLVYCTCTINPAENETNVRFALDRWGKWLSLEQAAVEGVAAGPGLTGVDPETGEAWLRPDEADKVMRFCPSDESLDCIGFFVSKFTKTRSML